MDKESFCKITHTKWFLNIALPGAGVIFIAIFFYLIFSKNYLFALLLFVILLFAIFFLFQDYFLKICSKIKIQSILKLLFWLTIVTAITGASFLAIPFGPLHILPFRLFLVLILLLIIMQILLNKGQLIIPTKNIRYYLLFLFIWFCYAVLTLLWVRSKTNALQHIFFILIGLLIILLNVLCLKDIKNLKRFYILWLIITICLLIMGLWEHSTGNHLPISCSYEVKRPDIRIMPTGTFHNTNDYSTFLALSIPFILSWLHYQRGLLKNILGIILLGFSSYFIIINLSRGGLLAEILEICVFLLFLTRLKINLKLILSLCLAVIVLHFLAPDFIPKTANEISISISESPTRRIELVKSGLFYLYQSFGFGVGAGNIEWHIATFSPYHTYGTLNLHNWWIEILADYGIFIFIGYLAFYFGLINNLWKAWRHASVQEKLICESILLSLIGFPLTSLSPSSIMGFEPHWLIFGFALAFLNYYRIYYPKVKTVQTI